MNKDCNVVKFFQVISQVEWLNSEQTNVLSTISVLILRVVAWLGIQSIFCIPAQALCSLLQQTQSFSRYIKERVNPQLCHNPEDEGRDGPRNVGLFTVQPLNPADNPKKLHHNHLPGKRQIVR